MSTALADGEMLAVGADVPSVSLLSAVMFVTTIGMAYCLDQTVARESLDADDGKAIYLTLCV